MNNKLSTITVLLVLLSWAGHGLAGPIINSTEWYHPAELRNYSYDDFASICNVANGQCSGSLAGGENLTGWIWASVDDVNALFNYFIGSAELGPGPSEYYEQASLWAPAFVSIFTPEIINSERLVVDGITRTTWEVDSQWAYKASIADEDIDAARSNVPIVKGHSGVPGGWFFREASQVPAPPTFALMIWAIAALLFKRYTKG